MPRHRSSVTESLPRSPARAAGPAVLLALPSPETSADEVQSSLIELVRLLEGLHIPVADRLVQRGTRGGLPGKGKRHELARRLAQLRADHGAEPLVVVDGAVGPGQLRVLRNELEAEVVDRVDVILRVFAERARTRTAQLEVELARLRYEAPRVRDDDGLGDREGGGGRGERGHTNVQLRKHRIRERVAAIERALDGMRPLQEQRRQRRRDLPSVALVGYTNAGKSSLMRGLTGSEVLVQDTLFATLDTTVRALAPFTTPRILVTDTVGFIRNLPHELVTSFRSTLDEARDADLLLFVVDAADPQWAQQLAVTRSTIAALGPDAPPALIVFNKIDRADPATRTQVAEDWPAAIQVSAHDEGDLRRLHDRIVAFFDERMVTDLLIVPAREGRLLADIHTRAQVLEESWDEGDSSVVRLRVRALPEALARWRRTVPAPAIENPVELLALAAAHGLALAATSEAFDGSGLDFRVVHARDRQGAPWVLRTPRRPEVAEAAAVEARALRLLRSRLPVAIPDWRLHTPALIAYPRLPGTPAITIAPDGTPTWNLVDPAAPSARFLDGFAATLAALQAVDLDSACLAGLPMRPLGEAREELSRAMEQSRDVLRPPEAIWARWQRWLAGDAGWPPHLALVHGDLHPGHLLLADDGGLTGILDWTEAAIADPSIDLAMFHGCFGPAALEDLLGRFARAGGRTWPGLSHHAAERWAAFPAVVAAWALRRNDEGALAHARALLAAQSP